MKKKMGAVLLVIIISLALGLPAPQAALAAGNIIYVDADATGNDNGSSWENAYTDLQDALSGATTGYEIWVAEGTYKPVKPTDDQDRGISFDLVDGVPLYGGFAGDETTRDERDWVVNPTILSGNIGNPDDNSDNSIHVITSEDKNDALLDGFTITGGNANNPTWPHNSGGGINIDGSTITVKNTIIYDNTAAFRGGGLNILTSAGMSLSKVYIVNSIIRNNTSTGTSGQSGAFTGGGGICLNGPGTLIVTNSIINGNMANFEGTRNADGGGIRVGGGNTELNIINSTIVNNTCESSVSGITGGGGIRSAITTTIINSIFWDNEAGGVRNQIYCPPTTTAEVTYSNIEGGYAGVGNINEDPSFADSDFHLLPDSPCIDAGINYEGLPETDADGNERIFDGNGDGVAIVDMGAFEYFDPQVATQYLIEQVGDLVDSEVLNPGQGNSLIVKLEAAIQQMDRGNANVAIRQLQAFIKQVNSFMNGGVLSQEEGQPLIEAANDIIAAL